MSELSDVPRKAGWRTWAVFAVATTIILVGILGLVGLSLSAERSSAAALSLERDSYRIVMTASDLLSALEDAETGQRGFLLSGDKNYLEPYRAGEPRMQAALADLKALTADNPAQQRRVNELSAIADQRLTLLADVLNVAEDAGPAEAAKIIREGRGRRVMDKARDRVMALQREELRLLHARTAATEAAGQRTKAYSRVFFGLLAAALALLTWGSVDNLQRRSRARLAEIELRAALDLQTANSLLNTVMDAGQEAIYAKDLEGRFVLANRRALSILGANLETVLGKTDADFLPPEQAHAIEAVDREIMSTGLAQVVDEHVTEGGQLRVMESSKVPWRRGEEIVGLIGISRDVTAQRAGEAVLRDVAVELERRVEERSREMEVAQAQVRQLQKMESLGQLTGGIAHDFNNMLAIIIGSLDLARRRIASDPERAIACIGNAEEGARRAAMLTARLLAFSRQQPLDPAPLDANKLVGGMSELLRRTIGEHLKVETVLAGGLWRTFVDAGQLENGILNLCVNARDAMPDGGHLTIETCNSHLDDEYAAHNAEVPAGQYVLISVSDTGTGMPPEVIERAFDPFYTTKGVGKGTGLGLSQVYGFVKQSGGHVKIYSEPGHGTTVKIYLPRYSGTAASPSAVASVPRERPIGRAEEIILVTEDDPDVRHVSVDALRELGYTVIQAENGAHALQQVDLQPQIHLLFTDIVMPDMTGRRLADQARERKPGLKVLYTTGYTRNAVVHNGVLDPGVAFLPKPFTIDALAWKVREVLDAPA